VIEVELLRVFAWSKLATFGGHAMKAIIMCLLLLFSASTANAGGYHGYYDDADYDELPAATTVVRTTTTRVVYGAPAYPAHYGYGAGYYGGYGYGVRRAYWGGHGYGVRRAYYGPRGFYGSRRVVW
jgi:hypothetical protein